MVLSAKVLGVTTTAVALEAVVVAEAAARVLNAATAWTLGRESTTDAFFPLLVLVGRGSQSEFLKAPLRASPTGRDEILIPDPPIFVDCITTHPRRQSERRCWPRRDFGQRRPSKTRAGWLTEERGGPFESSRIASPHNSANKPRPRPWRGRNEGRARPGRGPRSPSSHSLSRHQELRRGRALRTEGTTE
ncbi:hypothetical protein Pyn_25137 [Prunus yedoensis var. nudiflora]|uniref:Uncharacterized protein n=1 Tax=Prunus yedoensis var. nudiflora TaxID=2094558 RepID=A0A314UX22_PRUYE|nr:hypothetical protein Pyn_25137 [Prunus yedoensis var. nudiflora]